MCLFENKKRIKYNVKPLEISLFQYFDTALGDTFDKCRTFWNIVFSKYPKEHQDKFKNDFYSKKDNAHIAACYELYIFWIFYRLGFTIKIHPPNISTKTHETPDFLISKGQNNFIVEAKCMFTKSTQTLSDSFKQQIITRINKTINSEKITATFKFSGNIKKQPQITKIVKSISCFIAKFEKEIINEIPLSYKRNIFDCGEFSIILEPRIKTNNDRKYNFPICPMHLLHDKAILDISDTKLLKKLKAKAKKDYKNHNYPTIFAFNIDTNSYKNEIFMNALFGKEIVRMEHENGKKIKTTPFRDDKSFWQYKGIPINTRISTVLFSNCIEVVNFKQVPQIFYNPYIDKNLPLVEYDCFTRYVPNNNLDEYDILPEKNFGQIIDTGII